MKYLHLTWSRFHSQGEPIAEVAKTFEISTFRMVFGGIHIRLKGQSINEEETYLKLHDGCLYYDGLYYSDIWIQDELHSSDTLEEFDPKKLIPTLPVVHPMVGDVIRILKEEVEVDGETMEFIIRQVGMEEQMMRQLSGDQKLQEFNRGADTDETQRLKRRLNFILKDVLKLAGLAGEILTEEAMAKENQDGESITRMIGNIEEACDLNNTYVDTEWKDTV